MEFKAYMSMRSKKSGFVLIITIILVILFSLYSLVILETNTISSNINKLKYLHLQAYIHMNYIKDTITSLDSVDINALDINDNRYDLNISKVDDMNKTSYYIYIKTKDETPICLQELVVKNN